jgi:hypothetical protein
LVTREELRVGGGSNVVSLRPQDKESKRRGVFMNTRTKLAIAVSAAMWMVPMTRAVAGIDVSAGDWKIDFSGNVNAFYVNAQCDDGANTAQVSLQRWRRPASMHARCISPSAMRVGAR